MGESSTRRSYNSDLPLNANISAYSLVFVGGIYRSTIEMLILPGGTTGRGDGGRSFESSW